MCFSIKHAYHPVGIQFSETRYNNTTCNKLFGGEEKCNCPLKMIPNHEIFKKNYFQ